MITFESMVVRNYVSIGEAKLSFSDGLHFVAGINEDAGDGESNGAGKTALLSALRWCLFGSSERDGAAEDVVNRRAGKGCEVSVTGTVGQVPFVVSRYRAHPVEANRLILVLDGRRVTGNIKAIQDEITSVLGLSEDLFSLTVSSGQGMPRRFLALSDPEKQELLCQISGAKAYDGALSRARERARRQKIAVG